MPAYAFYVITKKLCISKAVCCWLWPPTGCSTLVSNLLDNSQNKELMRNKPIRDPLCLLPAPHLCS